MLRAFGQIRTEPLGYLESVWREFGDVAQFPVPSPATYLVSSPAGARRVLVTNNKAYGKRTAQYRSLSLVTGEGLLTAETPVWRPARRLLQPAFHRSSLARVEAITGEATRTMLDRWQREGSRVRDVDAEMQHLTLDIVGQVLFGTDLSAGAERIARATIVALHEVVARSRNPLAPPMRVPTSANRRMAKAVATLDRAVADIMTARARDPLGPQQEPRDMLDLMLATNDDGERLSVTGVRDQIVSFIVAGHETVASALSWTMWEVSGDPAVAQRLYESHETRDDGALSGYARAVFDEVLRLYPPAWLITRRALEADVVDGHPIPANALVIISPTLVQRHPGVWTNALNFDPDRHLNALNESQREAYLPFGLGPRMCIGREMALIEGSVIADAIFGRMNVNRLAGQQVQSESSVTLRPRSGLPLVTSPRLSN
jgi:cytochrome P450